MTAMDSSTELRLPAVLPFQQFCTHENGWSDHYGALHTAAAYAGLAMPANYVIKGIWQHGCFGPWTTFSGRQLVYNSPHADKVPVFVARSDQADLLRADGCGQVRVIGLPILYTPAPNVARLPRSLLVMPTHSLTGAKFDDRRPFEQYADEIKAVAGGFDRVVVCVHPNCGINGLWVPEFTSRGFEIIYGAQTNDRNALLRMRCLFEQFEFVTSNGWGSHIAYALNFGARVSIYGTEIVDPKANALLDPAWAVNRASLEAACSQQVHQEKQQYLAKLHREPSDGLMDEAWGRWLAGAENKLPPDEMKSLLLRMVIPAAALSTMQSQARRTRAIGRQRARELSKAGRRDDAVRMLLQTVQADVASKQPAIIVDSLLEIGGDLAAIDPARGAYLTEEAKKLARATGLNLQDFVRPGGSVR